ncbi:3-hydroxy-9,10-secoandrosta-1,3,5(10)-triene-9,17-dione monooxygenase reductase component [Nocardioides zeae]|uniref:3-hydroxy-9,10-secoandrosta-1,3,5(10)-triene-9, 17-dione monooxygenase reductase component n=2 Tax=Nocardioides zeae TaxID=1457234 RepID=A0AAJ1X1Z4_9ACTN|nr:flavin reductase family protein [Nocardioides zeae]MDQ1104004.1 3-hydroxy-9,10-secoandrosta-1,3,5(10)-triene-9,17-dione monooxygenase reductase component [Nocardioides zeae]MDR6176304.1 3-hydroxy-9,10-secoandrosta-1,3,5(10)-triene-9,17-dione monooxygenase reductase component [Nocardioides zeae]MDR6210450.1 3-hydroxy-9,10-secoandrosta-1,3,5(10)-triene-9,17-dione monooxygenase reductase component [Nocardioides zeae]
MSVPPSVPLPDVPIPRLRDVMGTFATGVVVVTALDEGEPVGMTVQSFASLSLRPPLVVFAPARTSRTWPRVRHAGWFCVNVLAEDQADVAAAMASGGDRFRDLRWTPGLGGEPLLDGALAHVEATVQAVHDGGDHDLVVGRVRRVERVRDAAPLLYHRSAYARLVAEAPTAEQPPRPTVV